MKNVNKLFGFIIVLGFLSGTSACFNAKTKNDNVNQNESENSSLPHITNINDKESVFFLLPLPGEILETVSHLNIKYNPELLSSAKNKDKYIGSKSQALNLGVYVTDMAYAALFNRPAETVEYIEAIQSLSSEIGISSNIFETLIIRAKANTGKIDSLVSISNESFSSMLDFLETGGMESTIAQITAGSYIESLYIVLQSIDEFSEDDEFQMILTNLKYPFENLKERAKSLELGENENGIKYYLNQISLIFNEIEMISSETSISQEQKGKISIQGGDKFRMKKEDFIELKAKVSGIRKNIVNF